MMLFRRTAQGRLSEIFGPDTVGIDTLMRQLDLYGLAAPGGRRADRRDPRRARRLFRRGQRLAPRRPGGGARPRRARVLPLHPGDRPWVPADSIAVQKLLALQMTDKAAMETLRATLSLRLPPERLRDILPDSPNAPLMGLPEFSRLFPDGAAAGRGGGAHPLDPLAAPGPRRRLQRLRGDGPPRRRRRSRSSPPTRTSR